MNFDLNEDQQVIIASIENICARFDDAYWLERDREGGFPHDLHRALADAGWLGIAMSPDYGGAGLGMTEAENGDETSLPGRKNFRLYGSFQLPFTHFQLGVALYE